MKAKKIMQTVEEYYEIAPAKDKEVCSNCSYWAQFYHTFYGDSGQCAITLGFTKYSFTCDKFDLTENKE